MKMRNCFNHTFLLNCCNLMFLACGGALIAAGFYLFTDTQKILLSRLLAATSEQLNSLPQPLFYYASLGLAVAGTIAVLAAIIGFWASCLNTYCFLSLYFLIVVILLLAESAACLAITLWPHCLGLTLDESKMVKALQGNYGTPGREQFTIAMDLAQVQFGCCGMSSAINYDTSLWRLQGYGQRDWTVPLSCCKLSNRDDRFAHLDPQPANGSQCQALQKFDYERSRHTDACLGHLDLWYREQYVLFLGASLVVAVIEFCVLLSIVLSCTKIANKTTDRVRQRQRRRPSRGVSQLYEPQMAFGLSVPAAGGRSSDFQSEMRKVFVQPQDMHKNRHNTTFKPASKSNHYHISKSYLV